jgi:hypothetical protein
MIERYSMDFGKYKKRSRRCAWLINLQLFVFSATGLLDGEVHGGEGRLGLLDLGHNREH